MRKKISLLLFVIYTSCNHHHSPMIVENSNIDTLKNKIIGLWGGLGEDSAVWNIKADSIYYLQQSAAYPYKLIADSLMIYFPDHTATLHNLSAIQDTLTFKDGMGFKTFAYRFKNKK